VASSRWLSRWCVYRPHASTNSSAIDAERAAPWLSRPWILDATVKTYQQRVRAYVTA